MNHITSVFDDLGNAIDIITVFETEQHNFRKKYKNKNNNNNDIENENNQHSTKRLLLFADTMVEPLHSLHQQYEDISRYSAAFFYGVLAISALLQFYKLWGYSYNYNNSNSNGNTNNDANATFWTTTFGRRRFVSVIFLASLGNYYFSLVLLLSWLNDNDDSSA